MEERFAIVGVLIIVLVSMLAVVYLDSATGDAIYTVNAAGYGYSSKIYGGMLKKVNLQPNVLGRAYQQQVYTDRAQAFLYANQDKWNCSFGDEALTNPYPCVFDEGLGKYCCVVPQDMPERYGQWAPD